MLMYGCKSWTIKKSECLRIDAFKLWCWRRLLRDPWTARRSNQSILKEITLNIHWKDWCWSWNCNTLATWCEELTHWKRPWRWERLRAGGEGGDRGWDGSIATRLSGHEFKQFQEMVKDSEASSAIYSLWGHKDSDATETEQKNDTIGYFYIYRDKYKLVDQLLIIKLIYFEWD